VQYGLLAEKVNYKVASPMVKRLIRLIHCWDRGDQIGVDWSTFHAYCGVARFTRGPNEINSGRT